jgi:hypothetical protein
MLFGKCGVGLGALLTSFYQDMSELGEIWKCMLIIAMAAFF